MSRIIFGLVAGMLVLATFNPVVAKDEVFSGPQPGEKLANFKYKQITGDNDGKHVDPIATADGKPVFLVFVTEVTRPGFAMVRTLSKFVKTKEKTGITTTVVFLNDDRTKIEKQIRNLRKYFPESVNLGIALEGKDGPGAYGVNRNVKLTMLVGEKGKVTSNFAINQPQLEVDGKKVLKGLVAVTGGGKVPDIAELTENDSMQMRRTAGARGKNNKQPARQQDAKLTGLLRGLINKQADKSDVEKAKTEIEKYIAKNADAKKELIRISTTVVNSGKLSNYGTKPAQKVLIEWAKKLAPLKKQDEK